MSGDAEQRGPRAPSPCGALVEADTPPSPALGALSCCFSSLTGTVHSALGGNGSMRVLAPGCHYSLIALNSVHHCLYCPPPKHFSFWWNALRLPLFLPTLIDTAPLFFHVARVDPVRVCSLEFCWGLHFRTRLSFYFLDGP